MQNDSKQKHVALVGLMGSGKSSVGRAVAGLMRRPFVDTDEEVESMVGCKIKDIFARDGEAAFREIEEKVVSDVVDSEAQVIATGGGVVLSPSNRQSLWSYSVVFYLRAGAQCLIERIGKDSNRPLLHVTCPQDKLEKLLQERGSLYEQAHVIIDVQKLSIDAIAEKIIREFRARA
ncbi:MAG: shikimate kinase [Verrucomicrobiota bacterium]